MHSMTWLENYSSAGAALSLIIEGSPVTFGTDAGLAASTVFSNDDVPYWEFDDPVGGLFVTGMISQGIQLYTSDIEADTLAFKVLDYSGALLGTLLREGNSSGFKTYLTSSIVAGSTATINVKDTTGAAASGNIYIGGECIGYTGKTATTFTGITRGKYSVNLTDAGVNFSPDHTIGNNVVASATTAPAVTDFPRTWYGRFCHLLLHVKDPLTGAYNRASEARRLWSGRIENYDDHSDGIVVIKAKSVMSLLHNPVGINQWRAKVNEGVVIGSTMDSVTVYNTQGANYVETIDLGFANTRKSHSEMADALNAQFQSWNNLGVTRAGDIWSIELSEPTDGSPPVYVVHLRATSTAVTGSNWAGLMLHRNLWRLLGWGPDGSEGQYGTLKQLVPDASTSGTHHKLIAPLPPIVYEHENIGYYTDLDLTDEVNSFVTQSYLDIDAGLPEVNGVVEIRGGSYSGLYAVKYTSGNLKTRGRLDNTTNKWVRTPADSNVSQNGPIRLGDATEAPEVRQITYHAGPAGQLLLKLALSTGGAAGYNHATYDSFTTAGFGADIPASLIDVESWEEMDDVRIQLLITDPKPFYKYLEQVLAASNRYVIWRSSGPETQPKLTIVRPSLETTYQASWVLDESNKAGALQGLDRPKVTRASEGIINRVVLKHGNNLSNPDQGLHSLTIEHIASQSDYQRKRSVTIEAPTILNAADLISTTIQPALAYFARPLATVERTYNASCMRMVPGDTVTLTDNAITNPATGIRGGSIYCWVLDAGFDLSTGVGRCRLIFLPEKNVSYTGIWAPSARIDETATSSGYVAGTKTLTCKANEFSDTSGVADAARFDVGDLVHVHSLDEASPLEWFDEVASQTGNTIVLVTGLAGWDTSKRYVIEYDDISAALNQDQRNAAFIADDATLSTGYSTPAPYEWGQRGVAVNIGATADYSQGMFRPNTSYDDQGEPLSIHKQTYLVKGANNIYSYKTRQVHLSEYFPVEASQVGTASKLVFVAWIPLYGSVGSVTRDLNIYVRGRQSGGGTATITVASSAAIPTGSSFTSYSYPASNTSTSFATTSATNVWSGELTLKPVPVAINLRGMFGTWITIQLSGSAVGTTSYCNQIIVSEAAI